MPDLVWVPDLLLEAPPPTATGEPRALSGPQGVRATWTTWLAALLYINSRVPRLDGSEGGPPAHLTLQHGSAGLIALAGQTMPRFL